MASWKKVIVSGSQAHLAAVTASNLTDDRLVYSDNGGILLSSNVQINNGGHLVGQFSGSHEFALTDGNGIANFSYDGGAAASVAIDLSGSTLTVDSDGVAVNASGITTTEIANSNVTFAKIQDLGTMTVIGRTASGTGVSSEVSILDEDNMSSDSATALATQQSIKAYVDSQVGSSTLTVGADSGTDDTVDLDTDTLNFVGGNGIDTVVSDNQISINGVSGLISGSSQVVAALPSGTVSGSAQIRPLFSAVDTTGAAGIDMSYNSTNGQFSGSLVNSNITLGADTGADVAIDLGGNFDVAGGTNINTSINGDGDITVNLDSRITITDATGSFTGSFTGDGSGLTGIATTLNIDVKENAADSSTEDVTIDLQSDSLVIQGVANEISASASGDVITIGLPDDVTIGNDLTVTGDLVVQGDMTTLNTANLNIEDQFILLNSGSSGADVDAGIVFGGTDGTANTGKAVYYDAGDDKFGFSSAIAHNATTGTLSQYMGAIELAAADPTDGTVGVQGAGTIHVNTSSEDIFIYV